jgi:hypothetical protein
MNWVSSWHGHRGVSGPSDFVGCHRVRWRRRPCDVVCLLSLLWNGATAMGRRERQSRGQMTRLGHLGGNRNSKGIGKMKVRGRVWTMADIVTQWIRRWFPPNGGEIANESRVRKPASIGTLMQSDVNLANRTENLDRDDVMFSILYFLDNFVPECTEVVL